METFAAVVGIIAGMIVLLVLVLKASRKETLERQEVGGVNRTEEERWRLIREKEAEREALERRRKKIEWELEHKEYSSREMKADPEKLCDEELGNAWEYVTRELNHNPESRLFQDRLNEIRAESEKRIRLDKLAKGDEETRANIAIIAEDINAIRMKRDK